jgi:PleD family two-component response regulator
MALTVSFGVAEVVAGACDARTMLDDADQALYAAKRAGRDRVVRADQLAGRERPIAWPGARAAAV